MFQYFTGHVISISHVALDTCMCYILCYVNSWYGSINPDHHKLGQCFVVWWCHAIIWTVVDLLSLIINPFDDNLESTGMCNWGIILCKSPVSERWHEKVCKRCNSLWLNDKRKTLGWRRRYIIWYAQMADKLGRSCVINDRKLSR